MNIYVLMLILIVVGYFFLRGEFKMPETKGLIISKLTSGKFLLTMFLGITFCVLAIKGTVPPEDIKTAFLVVLYAYFTKRKDNDAT